MAKLIYEFIYNNVSFKLRDFFAYLSEVATYNTCKLSENNLFYLVLRFQELNVQ